jgi:hypothetical protein
MAKTLIEYTHWEFDGEEAIVYKGEKEVDRIDLNSLVEIFLEESSDHIQKEV